MFVLIYRDYGDDEDVANGFKINLEGFKGGSNETPFLTLSVKDYLWGYPSVLATMQNYQQCEKENEDFFDSWDDPCEHILEEDNISKMGVFYGRNGTSLDIRKINTGMNIVS